MSDLPKGWKYHLFSYRFEDSEYSFEIPARSADEARERLNRMFYATYDGEAYASIPVPAGGLLLRFARWLMRSSSACLAIAAAALLL
jgi:hypothetical protein